LGQGPDTIKIVVGSAIRTLEYTGRSGMEPYNSPSTNRTRKELVRKKIEILFEDSEWNGRGHPKAKKLILEDKADIICSAATALSPSL